MQWPLDCDELQDPTCFLAYQNALVERSKLFQTSNINIYGSLIKNALNSAGFVNCGLTCYVVTSWISPNSLLLLESRQSILPSIVKHSSTRSVDLTQIYVGITKSGDLNRHEMKQPAAKGNSESSFTSSGLPVGKHLMWTK